MEPTAGRPPTRAGRRRRRPTPSRRLCGGDFSRPPGSYARHQVEDRL